MDKDKKELMVVVAGSGERKLITIKQGTTVQDVLDQLGLQGYVLSKSNNPTDLLDKNKDLFTQVEDGQKLWASTPADVG